ncbi:conserved hypothetical protein [Leishmania infantum JPCM5]|uniref:Protein artemis n=2 Tax=Leishmania infantum TaxID=5671 RepID=A4IA93_LEIIN|nr:conserved hypothetical protein [Leishmania infantum JPCM5]CAM71749.2 conserved hypothetical protein [Leishmania infantum JPCM5]|eukprot:XP_001468662.2 conserved hypothetical protein [Leishmania infantum JPCM5]
MQPSTREAGAAASSVGRNGTMREYFKSREVYRGSQGIILVDAFRFVYHGAPLTDWACRAQRPSPPSANGAAPSGTPYSATSPVSNQGLGLASTSRAARAHTFYFLSHFHSDHYAGITNRWHSGTIYCSRPTATLTQSQLGVPASWLFPMDLGQTYIFSLSTGVCLARVPETPHHPHVQALLSPPAASSKGQAQEKTVDGMFVVRLIPANHCPGAVMFLFVSPVFGTVLHTGDFRFNGSRETWEQFVRSSNGRQTYVPPLSCLIKRGEEQHASTAAPPAPAYEQFIADDEALRDVAQRQLLDVLLLDNTFCAPAYKFPSQWEVTQRVIEVLRSLFHRAACRAGVAVHSAGHPQHRQVRCAVLIGCYTIGKERVALALRDAFPLVRSSEQSRARDSLKGSQHHANAAEPASWRIHVSPSRYALLSSIGFFEECFEPLKASRSSENAVTARDAGKDASTRPPTETAHVEDVPVLLPVLLGECNAQGAQRKRVASGLACKPEETRASAAPAVRPSLAVGLDMADGAGNQSAAEGRTEEVEHLLSVFLVPMASVGYQAVAALAHADSPAVVDIEDGLALNLDRYDQVLIVEPTGWCKRCVAREVSEKHTLLRVPYSEHCAFHELLEFVEFVNPARVVPTVSEEGFKQYEALFVAKAPRLRSRVSNVQPITRFFSVLPVHHAEAPTGERRDDTAATVASSAARTVLDGSSVSLAGAIPVEDPAVDDAQTASAASAVVRKRARAQLHAVTVAAPTSTATAVAATPSITCTLERLFQKVKRDAAHRSPEGQPLEEVVAGDDDDCQVVGVVQAVVEISDDD